MEEASKAVNLFCSYAHEDERWLRKLEIHLSLLKQQGLISLWHDRLIVPGTNWAKVIDTHLETASVILLLVSVDFFASDYCYGIEMKQALERQKVGEALVVPILVRPADWTNAPFAHLHVLPADAKPLSTWPDEETALADVAAGIRRVLEELPRLSASAPRAVLPAIWNIPYPRNPFFIGREDLLSDLHTQLQRGQPMAISQHPQAISGLGGIGKTQIAVEYAYRFGQEYQAVLWAHAESRETFISSYVTLATQLNLSEQDTQEQAIMVQAVKRWLQTHREWLLILDNANELALVPEFLPSLLGGHLLLTTQAQAMGRLASRIEVEMLSPEQGALFLLRRAGWLARDAPFEQVALDDRERAMQITKALGGLPLALDQAGAYLEETGCSLSEYQHLSQQHRADLLRERRGLVADHPAPVATTWSLSFQKVAERNPAAADLLRLCTFLAPDAIPEEILIAGTSSLGLVLGPVAASAFQCNQAIETLRTYSLVQRDPRGKTLSVHRLVQAVLQDTLEETERNAWAERAMLVVNAALPHVEHGTRTQCERLLTQALTVTEVIERYQIISQEAGRLLHETACYLEDRKRYSEAEPLYQRAIRIREQRLGSEHPDVASSLNMLAGIYSEQGKYAKAELLFKQALQIREKTLGPEHPDVAVSLNNLAGLYSAQNKRAEAETSCQRALQIREKVLGSDHPDVASSLNMLASLYSGQGKYAKAELLFKQALQIREKTLGPEHPDVAVSLNNLAYFYIGQKRYMEAEQLHQQALCIREKTLGPEDFSVCTSLNGLASLYSKQGKYVEAELVYQRTWSIWEKMFALGSLNVQHWPGLTGLADLYFAQGKNEQGVAVYDRIISLAPNNAATYLNRGYMYLGLKNCEYACTDFAKSASLQPENVNAAWMVVYAVLGKLHPGREIAERLEIIAALDPHCYHAYICQGVALGLRGKLHEGLIALEQALQLDPENEDAWFWKGMIYAYLGQNTVAIESIEQALHNGLPPILLTPLFWLEQERPQFYQEYAEPLLKRYGLA